MARLREELNVYQLLLMRSLLILQFRLYDKKIRPSDYEQISKNLHSYSVAGSKKVDKDIIAKFFNDAHKLNRPYFYGYLLDAIIAKLDIDMCRDFGTFDSTYGMGTFNKSKKRFLPIAHPEDVSVEIQREIIPLVNKTLYNFFPEDEVNTIDFLNIDIEKVERYSKRLHDNFLNSSWFCYFFYDSEDVPKLGRLTFSIGENPADVSLRHFRKTEDASFSGTIRFDKKESYIIFSGSASKYGENSLFMLFDAQNSDRIELMLGHFVNIGFNNSSVVWGNCVLQKITNQQPDISPASFYPSDPGFSEVHPSIISYLKYEERSFTKYPSRIFSLEKLSRFMKEEKNTIPYHRPYIRQQKEHIAYIAFPRAELDEDRRSEYFSAFQKLSSYLEKLGLAILRPPVANLEWSFKTTILGADHFVRSIEECDLFIFLYIDKVRSTSLLELAWAYQQGKKILVLSQQEDNIISRFKESACFEWLKVPSKMNNLEDIINWSTQLIPYFLKEKFGIPLSDKI